MPIKGNNQRQENKILIGAMILKLIQAITVKLFVWCCVMVKPAQQFPASIIGVVSM